MHYQQNHVDMEWVNIAPQNGRAFLYIGTTWNDQTSNQLAGPMSLKSTPFMVLMSHRVIEIHAVRHRSNVKHCAAQAKQ